jgi:hypothetical protein
MGASGQNVETDEVPRSARLKRTTRVAVLRDPATPAGVGQFAAGPRRFLYLGTTAVLDPLGIGCR